jgi:hypothetical protein
MLIYAIFYPGSPQKIPAVILAWLTYNLSVKSCKTANYCR